MANGVNPYELVEGFKNMFRYSPKFICDKLDDLEEKYKEVDEFRVEIAEIKGKIDILTRISWVIVAALLGLLIQGAL